MRQLLSLLLFFKFAPVLGQSVNLFAFPEVITEGQTIQSFVPIGWTIVDSTLGDLNDDNEIDVAFVIKSKDSLTTFTHIEQQGEELVEVNRTEKYPRRILIIVLKQRQKNNYRLINQSNSIIVGLHTKIEIANSTLKIEYNTNNIELTFSSTSKYYFSYLNEQLLLTKVDRFRIEVQRTEYCVLDFVSKKMELTKGKVNIGKPATEWKILDKIKLKTIKEFERPFVWYIGEGITI
jgi:hypothetical protein